MERTFNPSSAQIMHTTSQISQMLGMSEQKIRRIAHKGLIPYLNIEGKFMYILEEVLEALRQNCQKYGCTDEQPGDNVTVCPVRPQSNH